MKDKLLVISQFVPYDKVPHAGGKTHNYYLKRLAKDENFEVKLISYCTEEEIDALDLYKYGIDYELIIHSAGFLKKLKRGIYNIGYKLNPFDKFAGMCSGYFKAMVFKKIIALKKRGYYPKYILLEWTNSVLLVEYIKKIYPDAKIIASEHDVTFLGFERRLQYSKHKILDKIRYKNILRSEINAVEKCDLVLTHNVKDYKLLKETSNKIKDIDFICPFYMNLEDVKPNSSSKNLIFFGAMDREENYKSCIWFIENVFCKLVEIDNEFKLYIVGNKPNEKLTQRANESIIVTGFVEDIKPYFNNSLCMVAPLLLGAGIKVKILEGMSAGLVVLTNEIGIEGIPAKSHIHYIHCVSPQDYLNEILKLRDGITNANEISNNCKKQLKENFSLESSFRKMENKILNL